jgi:uncharacterized protein (TIGR02597 family)
LGDTTAGQPAIKPNTDVWVSIPLLKPSVYAGSVDTVSGSQINFTGTPNLGDLTTTPHIAVIGAGPGTGDGIIGVITASTSSSVTITTSDGSTLSGVTAGDSVSIRPAWTVIGLMGTAMPAGTILYTYDQSSPFNPSATGVYEFDGTNWIDNVNTGEPANADVLYPYETLVVRNTTATPVTSFVVSGEVPTQPIRLRIPAAGAGGTDNAVSYFSPVGEQIGSSGLTAIANNGDIIYGFDNNASGTNKSASEVHEFSAGDWIDNVNTGEADNTYLLGSGRGFIYRRSTAASESVWSDTRVYSAP